jgi:hypothetical protein
VAFELHKAAFPGIAATGGILPNRPVALADAERGVQPIPTSNVEPFGVTAPNVAEAGATVNHAVTVFGRGAIVKVQAAASVGPGGNVGYHASGFAPVVTGSNNWRVGRPLQAAVAGEKFALYVDPRLIP